MDPRDIFIRPAAPSDAARVTELANALSTHEGLAPDVYDARKVRDDMIGDGRALDVLVAEDAGHILGYASYQDHYDTDVGARGLWLAELYVAEEARRRGIARQLMAALARIATERGLVSIGWAVRIANRRARDFYEIIGANDDDTRLLALEGAALASLAQDDDSNDRPDDVEDISLALERLKNPEKRWTQDELEKGLDLED